MQERNLYSQGTNPTAISGFRTKHQSNCTIVDDGNGNDFKITKIILKYYSPGHPTSIFGNYLFGKRFEI